MSGGYQTGAAEIGAEQFFVSEIVHNLSQPLTALQCSLELSLFRDQTVDQLRSSVEIALQNAECLRQRLLLLRELNDAYHPGDLSHPTELNGLLTELQEDLLPLFRSAGQEFELHREPGKLVVRGNKIKLTRALFYFLEYLFRYSADGTTLVLRVCTTNERQAEIGIATSSCLPVGPAMEKESGPQSSCEIELACRSFRAVGGDFVLAASDPGRSVWKATLPLAEVANATE